MIGSLLKIDSCTSLTSREDMHACVYLHLLDDPFLEKCSLKLICRKYPMKLQLQCVQTVVVLDIFHLPALLRFPTMNPLQTCLTPLYLKFPLHTPLMTPLQITKMDGTLFLTPNVRPPSLNICPIPPHSTTATKANLIGTNRVETPKPIDS